MRRVLRKLWEEKVRYILVGGLAMNLWGIPRTTADIDILLDLSTENLKKFLGAMKKLNLKLKQPFDESSILDGEKKEKIIRERGAVFTFENSSAPVEAIDFFLENPLDFDVAWRRKKIVRVEDFEVYLAHPDDIIYLKKLSGRPQDIEDIKALEKLKKILGIE